MKVTATREQSLAIVGAMKSVASANPALDLTDADRMSLGAAYHYLLRQRGDLALEALPRLTPQQLAAALPTRDLGREAAHILTVMAFVDGSLDAVKIEAVLRYAAALGIDEPYVQEIAEAAHGEVQRALVDMGRNNMESITGDKFLDEDATDFFLPYRNGHADPALVARYEALGALPEGSFGRAFWEQYKRNDYVFPGGEMALNERFAQPHDSLHVLSGYDTTPRGELLVSTFTAASHPFRPMEGHVLPVIFSWHLGIRINDVAKSAVGALDPVEFWHAWARGEATTTDVFAPGWDFWACAERSLDEMRRDYGIPPP